MENYCVICGAMIPEGRMACPICEKKVEEQSFIRDRYRRQENTDETD